MLAPFWGVAPEKEGDPVAGRFDRFAQLGGSFLRLTSLAACDVAVFPSDWQECIGDAAVERAQQFADLAAGAGKPMVVFFWSDREERVPLDAITFRTSLRRSTRTPAEFAQPAWSEDFLERHLGGNLVLRKKSGRPAVGFCGFVPPAPSPPTTVTRKARRALGNRKRALQVRLGGEDGHAMRARAVQALQRHDGVDTNILLRSAFWGGAIGEGTSNADELRRVRHEYLQVMLESDYTLCVRGQGNFSYRLYETLSCGRIPVFVDSDCVLPLDFAIDWRDYCVWVDESDLSRVGERVAEFHESLSDVEFGDLQKSCRRLWETHISPEGFFSQFGRHFC